MSSALDALLDELATRVADKLAVRLASPSTHYGTGKAATLPPGKSRQWALRTLKTIPGAYQIGRDWVVRIEDFEAWLTAKDTAKFRRGTKPKGVDVDALADLALAKAGFRRVG